MLTAESHSCVQTLLSKLAATPPKDFANARTVRNLYEDAVANQANRISGEDLSDTDVLTRIVVQDIPEL